MALYKIKDFDPDYTKHMNNRDVKGLDVYVGAEKIGSVNDLMVDEQGQFRYVVVDTGSWLGGKKVLLPIGRARVDSAGNRVYADNLTKAQAEALPEFTEELRIDYDHEEQVRGVYRGDRSTQQRDVTAANTVGYTGTERMPATADSEPMLGLEDEYAEVEGAYVYDRNTYQHEQEPDLYAVNEQNHPNFKLYEERLVTSKTRQKTGETVISKRVETEIAQASVPVEKERVVIEQVPGTSETVAPGVATFQEGEVSRVEVYEEVPEFHKEAFVREEVRVNKVVDKENATVQDTIRREELDVDNQGNPVVKPNPN